MGKGNDPNCGSNATSMVVEAQTQRRPSPARLHWKALQRLSGQPDIRHQAQNLFLDNPQRFLTQHGGPAFSSEAWQQALNGYTCARSGLSVRIPEFLPYRDDRSPAVDMRTPTTLNIYADIMDGDTPVGDLGIYVLPDQDGFCELRIGALELRRYPHLPDEDLDKPATDHSRRGFASGLVGHLEHVSAEMGVARMSLNAVGGGCAAWARMGFVFDPRGAKHPPGADIREQVSRMADEYAQSMIRALERQSAAGIVRSEDMQAFSRSYTKQKPLTPQGLVGLAADRTVTDPEQGRNTPIGYYAATQARGWEGVKFLLPPSRCHRMQYPQW